MNKNKPCGYDGSKKKLKDGRCAACGRTQYEGDLEAVVDAARRLYINLIDAEDTHNKETGKEYDDVKALRVALSRITRP